jgi:hypothetical protein
MSSMQNQHRAALVSAAPRAPQAAMRWRHPFDSATGTIALGVLLTIVLVLALKLLSG